MKSQYIYKFKGSLEEFQNKFEKAIESYNKEYPNTVSPVIGKCNGEKIEIGLKITNHSSGYYYLSDINYKGDELRFEGVLDDGYKDAFLILILRFLVMIVQLPFRILFWLIRKILRHPIKHSVSKKLRTIMLDYIGCGPSDLIETEETLEQVLTYLTNNENFSGNFELDNNTLFIKFNEYFSLYIVFENQLNEAYVSMNNGLTHWHPLNTEVLDEIKDYIEEKIFIIENRNIISRVSLNPNVKFIDGKRYNAVKKKYIGRRSIRIYTGKRIIQ